MPHLERFAVRSVDPLSVDIGLGAKQVLVHQAKHLGLHIWPRAAHSPLGYGSLEGTVRSSADGQSRQPLQRASHCRPESPTVAVGAVQWPCMMRLRDLMGISL